MEHEEAGVPTPPSNAELARRLDTAEAHIMGRLREMDMRFEQRFAAQEKAVEAAQLADQSASFLTRKEYDGAPRPGRPGRAAQPERRPSRGHRGGAARPSATPDPLGRRVRRRHHARCGPADRIPRVVGCLGP